MEASKDLVDVVMQFYAAVSGGDNATISRLTSKSERTLTVGTAPDEWWLGHEKITDVYRSQMDEMGGGFPITPNAPSALREGSVGWVADQPTLKLPDGSELPMRLTAVLHIEENEWKFVQVHVSFGTGNEETFGVDLSE